MVVLGDAAGDNAGVAVGENAGDAAGENAGGAVGGNVGDGAGENAGDVVEVRKGKKLKTFETWGPDFSVSFNFNIKKSMPKYRYINLLHMTAGKNCCNRGTRLPAIYLYRTNQWRNANVFY